MPFKPVIQVLSLKLCHSIFTMQACVFFQPFSFLLVGLLVHWCSNSGSFGWRSESQMENIPTFKCSPSFFSFFKRGRNYLFFLVYLVRSDVMHSHVMHLQAMHWAYCPTALPLYRPPAQYRTVPYCSQYLYIQYCLVISLKLPDVEIKNPS